MKITIWINQDDIESLKNFIGNDEPLPPNFKYWIEQPSSAVEGIYVLQILLSFDDYVRLRDC
jgi:hypothetical protein|tara:strand:- start:324 stop:509 length:186 start_codon:yes stop_codon:yes gene_type:complete